MNHDFRQIKQDYQNIKVPETLKPQIEYAISKAKADMEHGAGKAKGIHAAIHHPSMPEDTGRGKTASIFRFPLVKAAASVAAAALVLIVLANSGASVSYAMEQVPILGAIVKVVAYREYTQKDRQMEANIKIPKIQAEQEENGSLKDAVQELNDTVKAYTDEIIAAYEADVKAAGGEGTQSVDLDYEVVTDNDRLFSLRFHQTVTMAGAAQMEKIYHIDKQAGKIVTLEDLFQEGTDYKTPISANIKQQMKEQMAQDESKIYYVDSEMPEWDFKELPDNANFYVNESGKLVIVFDEYQVAPGYMGAVTFEIPTKVVENIVKDGYLK